jgi:hypothetical protein
MAATRSPQEVFSHHAQALGAEDPDEIVADYSEDAIFITPAGVLRGKDGIRQAFTKLLGEVPQATWDLKTTIPSSSATASSGSRPSATAWSPLPERKGWRCDRTSSSTPKV